MKWIDIELGGTMMWLREDTLARVLATNLMSSKFRLQTRSAVGEQFVDKGEFPTLNEAKSKADASE